MLQKVNNYGPRTSFSTGTVSIMAGKKCGCAAV
jgi:hypothetical protein